MSSGYPPVPLPPTPLTWPTQMSAASTLAVSVAPWMVVPATLGGRGGEEQGGWGTPNTLHTGLLQRHGPGLQAKFDV